MLWAQDDGAGLAEATGWCWDTTRQVMGGDHPHVLVCADIRSVGYKKSTTDVEVQMHSAGDRRWADRTSYGTVVSVDTMLEVEAAGRWQPPTANM